MKTEYKTLKVDVCADVVRVTFNRDKDTNAFSRTMTLELMDVCQQLARQPEPHGALLLTGGTGRSFSVGGDFHDVSALEEPEVIRSYLGEIFDLYIAILNVGLPVVAACDHFAIGQGLQVALMADWRVGSERCRFSMPELKNGVACPLGSMILEFLLGRAAMLELVMDCQFLDAPDSRRLGLLNQVSSVDELQQDALAKASKLAAYPRTSFVTTKRIHNQRFIDALESVRESSTQAHVAAFLRKTGKKHFDNILGRPADSGAPA